jgi:hypothetical protein
MQEFESRSAVLNVDARLICSAMRRAGMVSKAELSRLVKGNAGGLKWRGRERGRLRFSTPSLPLGPFIPASLADASLEVGCCGCDVLACLVHC